jgi:hypothetical protein
MPEDFKVYFSTCHINYSNCRKMKLGDELLPELYVIHHLFVGRDTLRKMKIFYFRIIENGLY